MKFDYEVEVTQEDQTFLRRAGPSFTAYEAPETRVPRLAKAYGYANETVKRMSVGYQNAFKEAISNLHDHKGILEITWRSHTDRMMFEGTIVGAWEAEGEPIVMHFLQETE